MTNLAGPTPVPWWQAEPTRFGRDRHEVVSRFPDLVWQDDGAGVWFGILPMWPFDRPEPEGLSILLAGRGLHVAVVYRQAYPMVPPQIFPLDPRPEPLECTQHRWHVNGDGSLCQFQTHTAWDPRDSVCDLIVKAAAWRIEYALMKADAIDAMTLHGIVSDPSLDTVITETAHATSGSNSPANHAGGPR